MSASVDQSPQGGRALRLHRQLAAIWATGPGRQRFAGKIDAVPGHVNILRIQADEPGRYEGHCSEFCGVGHTRMGFTVIVHPAKDFSAELAKAAASSKVKE